MVWLAGCRRLHRRYERKAEHFLAFTSIACTLICEDIDMVRLDVDTAGCTYTWINNGGALDPERRRILQTCVEDLDRVIPQISDPSGRRYYQLASTCPVRFEGPRNQMRWPLDAWARRDPQG